jgi:hypothetical protein
MSSVVEGDMARSFVWWARRGNKRVDELAVMQIDSLFDPVSR